MRDLPIEPAGNGADEQAWLAQNTSSLGSGEPGGSGPDEQQWLSQNTTDLGPGEPGGSGLPEQQWLKENTARANGYSWGEIDNHIASRSAEAAQAGYTQDQIDEHLGYQPPSGMLERARRNFANTMASSNATLDGLSSEDPELLLGGATTQSDYANAIANNEIKGPQDFSDHYAAEALNSAAQSLSSPLSDQQTQSWLKAGASAADDLAQTLPSPRDFTDSALSIGHGVNFDTVRQNLLDHWSQTGQHPIDAAMQAMSDPAMAAALGSTPVDRAVFGPALDLAEFAKGIREGVLSPSDDLKASLQKSTSPEFIGAILGRYPIGMVLDAFRGAGQTTQNVMQGRGATPVELLNAALLGLDIKAPDVPVLDSTKPPAEAISQAPLDEAAAAPKAAIRKPVEAPPTEGAASTPQTQTTEPPTPAPFEEGATPAEKVEALAQEVGNAGPEAQVSGRAARIADAETSNREASDEFGDPNFFSNLVKGEDQRTQDLAKAYDDAAAFINWDKSIFGSEAGGAPNPFEMLKWPDTLQPGTRRAIILGKNTAEDLIRRGSNGPLVRDTEALASQLEPYHRDFAPFMPEWTNAVGAAKADTFIGRWYDAVEGRGPMVDPSDPLYPFTRTMQRAYEKARGEIEQRVANGTISNFQARENYITHMVDLGQSGGMGGGRTGSLGSLRERTYDTVTDLLREGYTLKEDSPVVVVMRSINTMRAALRTLDMLDEAKKSNWVRTVSSASDRLDADRDGFKPILGLGSTKTISTVGKDGEPGPPITHQLYAQEGFSNIWNNWTRWEAKLSNEKFRSIYDAMLYAKNSATYFKLINPAFHLNTEIKLAMRNGLANAMTELGHGFTHGNIGEIARGILDGAISLTPGAKTAEYVLRSAIWDRPAYRALKSDPALEALVKGGGNISGLARVYAPGEEPSLTRSFKRGTLGQEISNDFRKAFTFPEMRNGGQPLTDIKNLTMFPFHQLSRIAATAVAPIWNQMIPLLKAGAKLERIRTFIRQNPAASDDMLRHTVSQIDRNVEGMMGEMEQRNLFWHPVVKRAANMSLLSTSWKYGTIETTLNGLGYRMGRGFNWDPAATTSLMAQIATVAFTNAAWNFFATGQLPQNTLDYMIPFANARGLARVLIPGEEKEYYDWLKIYRESMSAWDDEGPLAGIQQAFSSTAQYGENALANIWRAAIDWFNGEYWDSSGHKQHIGTGAGTFLNWFESEFAPIMTENWDRNAQKGISPWQNFMGWRVAPKWLSDQADWRAQQEKYHAKFTRQSIMRTRSEGNYRRSSEPRVRRSYQPRSAWTAEHRHESRR